MASLYVDYTYYTDTYGGSAIASADFTRLATKASLHIDRLTFDRAKDVTDADDLDSIKMATCAVADKLNEVELGAEAESGIQSEKVGNYSVTYAAGSIKLAGLEASIQAAARPYLELTGLIFPGFNPGEYGDNRNWTQQ